MLVRVARVKEMDMARSTVVLVSMQRPGEGEIAFGGGGASAEDDAAPAADTSDDEIQEVAFEDAKKVQWRLIQV